MNVHHVGYVVKEIWAAAEEFERLGYHLEGVGGG